jgi:hypothetical protein
MVKQVYKINSNGLYVEPVVLSEGEELPSDCVEVMPIWGLYKAKWTGTTWIESLTQEEIDAIKNAPIEPSETEVLKKQVADLAFELMIKGVL